MPIRNLAIEPLKFDTPVTLVGERGRLGLKFGETGFQELGGPFAAELYRISRSDECHYCGNQLVKTDEIEYDDTIKALTWYDICKDCGFWRWQDRDDVFPFESTIPLAKDFDPDVATPALEELAAVVLEDPSRVYALDPKRFEILVGSIFRNYFQCEVFHCGRSGDGGVDLVAVRGEKPLMIQVKRRTKRHALEGVESVRLLVASTILRGETEAVLITSAQRFTAGATSTAEQFSSLDRRFRMSLIDMSRLLEMVEATCSQERCHPYQTDKECRERGVDDLIAEAASGDSGIIVRTGTVGRADYFMIARDAVDRVLHMSTDAEADLLEFGFEKASGWLREIGAEHRIFSMTTGYDRLAIPHQVMRRLQAYVAGLPQSRVTDLVETA